LAKENMTDSPSPISIAIIEDSPAFLDHILAIVSRNPNLRVVGAASNGIDGIALIDAGLAQVYLVDLGLPDISGIKVIEHASKTQPGCEIMVLTMFGDEEHVVASIEAGATGYLLKDSTASEISEALSALCDGGSPVSPSIARKILRRFAAGLAERPPIANTPPAEAAKAAWADDVAAASLTGREVQILRLLAKGLTFGEIGVSLAISSHTVARHVKNIYRKLAVKSRGEAVYQASRAGIITL
jgi:DNA-binding NarL/FixJ family response regulator